MNITPHCRAQIRASFCVGLLLASALAASGQVAASDPNTADRDASEGGANHSQVVQMSAFEVRTTEGNGYVQGNSASAFKTSQSLMDIPQSVLVLTSDFIKDTGGNQLTDILEYAGAWTFDRGEDPMIRGSRDGYFYLDDLYDIAYFSDNIYIDTIQVLKGPTAVLYPSSSLTGIVLKTTKKPLAFAQSSVNARVDSLGGYRGEFDSTGAMGNLGEVKLRYRVLGAYQGGGVYFANERFDVKAITAVMEADYKNTIVLVAYDFQKMLMPPQANGILTPTGDLYTGAGRRYSDGWFPGQMENVEKRALRGSLHQKFSDTWEMRFSASYIDFPVYGGNAVNTSENWQTMRIGGIFRENNEKRKWWQVQQDFEGVYYLGALRGQSTMGFNLVSSTDSSQFYTTSVPNTYSVPMGSVAAINATYVPQQPHGDYPVPANGGTESRVWSSNIYYQQNLDIIPNLLTLVAGFTFANTETISDTNLSFNAPYAATDLNGYAWLHRIGAVVHITKELSLYALTSTNFGVNGNVGIDNQHLPNIQQKGNEVGLKTAFWGGRLTSTVSAFNMQSTNGAVFSGLTNSQGVGYYIPVGTTTTRGWDGDISAVVLPGWQMIVTGEKAPVVDQNHAHVGTTFGNMWSLFTRYDFARGTALKGFAFGGGVSRVGERYIATGGVTLPVGWTLPAFEKVHEGTPMTAFAVYKINRNWTVRVNCSNLLDEQYPAGTQSAGIIDAAPPRTFAFTAYYNF